MKFTDYTEVALLKPRALSVSKKKVIEELVGVLVENKNISTKASAEVCKALLKREALGSTGIGQGVALPHVKFKGVKKISFVFTNSEAGIEFNSLDGEPVNIIFLLIGPEKAGEEYIKVLSALARHLNDPYFRRDLVSAKKGKEVLGILKKAVE
ncbi:PTS sugar transporter subunit IIA [bacterium]|nr:PTS sugar transporter subunit IIA [bacterium]MBU3956012.1 PTS sugar transporter subunit IIA [bacterium]MBU4134365.1 PTS sugar transporter subunit IIA [bacterium]